MKWSTLKLLTCHYIWLSFLGVLCLFQLLREFFLNWLSEESSNFTSLYTGVRVPWSSSSKFERNCFNLHFRIASLRKTNKIFLSQFCRWSVLPQNFNFLPLILSIKTKNFLQVQFIKLLLGSEQFVSRDEMVNFLRSPLNDILNCSIVFQPY